MTILYKLKAELYDAQCSLRLVRSQRDHWREDATKLRDAMEAEFGEDEVARIVAEYQGGEG